MRLKQVSLNMYVNMIEVEVAHARAHVTINYNGTKHAVPSSWSWAGEVVINMYYFLAVIILLGGE